MPILAFRNNIMAGNMVVVEDTETRERYEVYLNWFLGRDGESILALVDPLSAEQLIGRVDSRPLNTPMWRCWVNQMRTPRWDLVRGSTVGSVGNANELEEAGALACDVVDAYRYQVRGHNIPDQHLPLSSLVEEASPVTRVSRYARGPVI
jgi:hypothetical protein